MWLLPWEKLPPLILGPLLILIGVFVFLVPEIREPSKQLENLLWGAGLVAGGIAITAYGAWKQTRNQK